MRVIFALILFVISCSAAYPTEESDIQDSEKNDMATVSNPPYQNGGGGVCTPPMEFTVDNQTFYQPAVCPIPYTNSKPEPDPDPLKEKLLDDEVIKHTFNYTW